MVIEKTSFLRRKLSILSNKAFLRQLKGVQLIRKGRDFSTTFLQTHSSEGVSAIHTIFDDNVRGIGHLVTGACALIVDYIK